KNNNRESAFSHGIEPFSYSHQAQFPRAEQGFSLAKPQIIAVQWAPRCSALPLPIGIIAAKGEAGLVGTRINAEAGSKTHGARGDKKNLKYVRSAVCSATNDRF